MLQDQTRKIVEAALNRDLPALIKASKNLGNPPSTMSYLQLKRQWIGRAMAFVCQHGIPDVTEAHKKDGFDGIMKIVHDADIQHKIYKTIKARQESIGLRPKYKYVLMYFMTLSKLDRLGPLGDFPENVSETLDLFFALDV